MSAREVVRSATAERAGAPTRQSLAAPQCWIYSSFADGAGGGNPAGVVIAPGPLEDEVAQAVAAVLSVPTTGFVAAPEAGAKSLDVRFFTPDCEIDACGHVTIAVAAALVDEGVWSWGDEVSVRARGGDFPIKLRDGATEMTQRLRLLGPAPLGWGVVGAALGTVARHPALPLALAGAGLRHLVVPLTGVGQLSHSSSTPAVSPPWPARPASTPSASGHRRRIPAGSACATSARRSAPSRSRPRARPPPRSLCIWLRTIGFRGLSS